MFCLITRPENTSLRDLSPSENPTLFGWGPDPPVSRYKAPSGRPLMPSWTSLRNPKVPPVPQGWVLVRCMHPCSWIYQGLDPDSQTSLLGYLCSMSVRDLPETLEPSRRKQGRDWPPPWLHEKKVGSNPVISLNFLCRSVLCLMSRELSLRSKEGKEEKKSK